MDALKNNRTDLLTSVAKSVGGTIPFAGPFVSELIGAIIPNQRIDRISKYLIELDKKINQLPTELLEQIKNNENFIDLVEEGFYQASRALSDERKKYIASIIYKSLTDEIIKIENSKFLMKLLAELNDVEIIWLRYYHDLSNNEDEVFYNKHKNILDRTIAVIGDNKETKQKEVLQNNYIKHLERLGLIKNNLRIDSKTKMPVFDRYGQPIVKHSETTYLGDMLLEQIGLIEADTHN